MPQLAESLGTSIEAIGYLVTIFALAMALGGPLLIVLLRNVPPRTALVLAYSLFLLGNILAATATNYPTMAAARIIGGMAGQAIFGISVTLCARMVSEDMRGRAVGVAMNGLMLGTLLGLPLASYIGGEFGWRWAFWVITLLSAVALVLVALFVRPPATTEAPAPFLEDIAVLRRPQLLLALASSTLIIGATFAVFSYVAPIFTSITGFSSSAVPALLLAYGAATVVGNSVVARLADRHTITVVLAGTALNLGFLTGLALFVEIPFGAVAMFLGIGLVGVTMNPAMAVRVQRAGHSTPLVNTIHASFITMGIVVGSSLGAALIPTLGLRGPIVLGIALAALAIVAILPALASPFLRRGTTTLTA